MGRPTLPRTPNQQHSELLKDGSNEGGVSCKSVFQALSQHLQIEEKLSFAAFDRSDQLRHSVNSPPLMMADEEEDEDDEQNLSFFLSNESSKQRDSSRVTGGDDSFQ